MIQQGHRYKAPNIEAPLIAVCQFNGMWKLREIDGEWLGAEHFAHPEDLQPLPMKYFHNQLPYDRIK
jgi:hypothetical protein